MRRSLGAAGVLLALAAAVTGKVHIRRHRTLPSGALDAGLLMMGSVGKTTARFLAEASTLSDGVVMHSLGVSELHHDVEIGQLGAGLAQAPRRTTRAVPVRSAAVPLLARPRAIELTNLREGTVYQACLTRADDSRSMGCVQFRTDGDGRSDMANTSAASARRNQFVGIDQHRVYVVSCDRWSEDGDDGTWAALLAREDLGSGSPGNAWERRKALDSLVQRMPDGSSDTSNEAASATFAHLGDQVYMDAAAAGILARSSRLSVPEMVVIFRQYYRTAWTRPTMQKILRFGAHYFLPDDHDVFNNVRGDLRRDSLSADGLGGAPLPGVKIRHSYSGANRLNDVIMAAYVAYVEYQFQASEDIPGPEGAVTRTLRLDVTASPGSDDASADPLLGSSVPALDAHLLVAAQAADQATRLPGRHAAAMPARHWGMPHDASQVFRVGSTAFLMVDTRLHRTFSYHPVEGSHHIMSASSLARVFGFLRDLERDGSVDEVVVLSSIPLLWMDETMALLADLHETDRYTTHPRELPGSIALFELLAASSKTRLLVGGDVHVQAHASACRNPDRFNGNTHSSRMREAHAQAVGMLARAMTIAGEEAAARHWPGLAGNPDAVLRALARALGNAQPSSGSRRCFVQLVTSGMSWGSAALAEEVIAVYNAMLRWASRLDLGLYSGRIHDVYLSNNYVRLDTGTRRDEAEWWSPAASEEVRYNRWPKLAGVHTPLSCQRLVPHAAGMPVMDFETAASRDVHGDGWFTRQRRLDRQLARAEAAGAASPSDFKRRPGSFGTIGCECGAAPGSSVAFTACRRWIKGENEAVQDAVDAAEAVFLSPERAIAALAVGVHLVVGLLAAMCCAARGARTLA